jgi:hypothetical protein
LSRQFNVAIVQWKFGVLVGVYRDAFAAAVFIVPYGVLFPEYVKIARAIVIVRSVLAEYLEYLNELAR